MKQYLQIGVRIWSVVLFFLVFMFLLMSFSEYTHSIPWLSYFLRHGNYSWDYEAMFATINLVWGIYLWKASGNLSRYEEFLGFTAWANLAHGAFMFMLALVRADNYSMLLGDGFLLLLAGFILLYLNQAYRNEK